MSLPNDSDAAALRRLTDSGSDLSRPMTIDFQIAAPDEPTARSIAAAAEKLSYRTSATKDDGRDQWTVNCTTRMVLNYDSARAIQAELHQLAKPLGGWIDGWGTFGNVAFPAPPP
jgi:regulator of RNase E activity RraB